MDRCITHTEAGDRGAGEADGRWGPGSKLGIIGGLGDMGRLFARFFAARGYQVSVSDPAGIERNEALVRESDLVLFAVPLHHTTAIIRALVPITRPGQLLMDLTSLKRQPVEEMLRSPAAVVGLHPMFGGQVGSFAGQTLIACPVRIEDRDWAVLKRLFEASGLRVKQCTIEEHDRMMSIVQVLFHVNTMLVGRVLRELGVDIDQTLEYTSPSYLLEMDLLGRIFAQNSELYAAITQLNPHTGEILEAMREAVTSYQDWYRARDLQAFIADFQQSSSHLGPFCRRAYRESSEILEYVVRRKHELRLNGAQPEADDAEKVPQSGIEP